MIMKQEMQTQETLADWLKLQISRGRSIKAVVINRVEMCNLKTVISLSPLLLLLMFDNTLRERALF